MSHPSSLLLALRLRRLRRLVQRALAQEAAGVIEALLAADGFVGPGGALAEGGALGGVHSHGGSPIAGWFRENPKKNG